MDYNQAVDQLKNKHAEATLLAGGVPTAAVIDIMTSGEGRLLSLPDDYIKQLVAKYPWYSPFTIPAGSYPKQERAVKTWRSPTSSSCATISRSRSSTTCSPPCMRMRQGSRARMRR